MDLTGRLTRPFKKRYAMYADKVGGFVVPIKDAVAGLLGHFPDVKAFAGSEDLADSDEASAGAEGAANGAAPVGKVGLLDRIKYFKKSLKEMSDFQKLILLTIAVVLPAGILVATILVGLIKKHKK